MVTAPSNTATTHWRFSGDSGSFSTVDSILSHQRLPGWRLHFWAAPLTGTMAPVPCIFTVTGPATGGLFCWDHVYRRAVVANVQTG